ncbi:MAG: hypothetical protein CMI02_18995 [Oceanospirillaceae bacterium]|nr:hypothetical protein [Oceanospirillaceae bacterium]MBT14116.1 hypothetical protein [Oceanospirillaceae bacterium]|tara:strand:- start:22574 stop:24487 length:1914 start_codon:yes stop_codon:yes gene_type:complete
MLINLSDISVRNKLLAPVVLLIILFIIVLYFYRDINSVIDNAEERFSSSKEIISHINAIAKHTDTFTTTRSGYTDLQQALKDMIAELKTSSLPITASLQESLQDIESKTGQIAEIYQSNEQINKDVNSVVQLSVKQSNDFIYSLSKALGSETERNNVSTFERLTIGPALTHTINNYKILLLFQKLQENLSNKDSLIQYLDGLDRESDKAIVDLKGTPMYENAVAARKANGEVRRLSGQYIANLESAARLEQEISDSLNDLTGMVSRFDDDTTTSVFTLIGNSLASIIIILVVLVIATIALSVLLGQSIVKPLNMLKTRIHQLAASGGDLTYRIQMNNKDEIGQLARGINNFLDSLHTIFKGISETGSTMEKTSAQAAELSKLTSSHMKHQRKETSGIATSFSEMQKAIMEISGSASTAADKVQETDVRAQEVVRTINTTIQYVNALREDLEETNDVIHQVNESSQNIGGILDVIRGIADQTNLLALNAAIEAARAGEQGRGFAVVADEVRSLAQRTQSSIEEIHAMIARLQEGASQAAEVIEKGSHQIKRTTEQSDKAGDGVRDISALVSVISDMNLQIASAVEQQSSVTQEINRSIETIERLSEEGNTAAEKSSDSAQQQSESSSALLALINKFTL